MQARPRSRVTRPRLARRDRRGRVDLPAFAGGAFRRHGPENVSANVSAPTHVREWTEEVPWSRQNVSADVSGLPDGGGIPNRPPGPDLGRREARCRSRRRRPRRPGTDRRDRCSGPPSGSHRPRGPGRPRPVPGVRASPRRRRPRETTELIALWHKAWRSLLKSRQHLFNEAESILIELPEAIRVTLPDTGSFWNSRGRVDRDGSLGPVSLSFACARVPVGASWSSREGRCPQGGRGTA